MGLRQRLAQLARPLLQRTASGAGVRRRLWQVTSSVQAAAALRHAVKSSASVVLDSVTTAAATTAGTQTLLPGLAVEIFTGADSRMPIPATKVPVAFNVAPCLNYSNINSDANATDGPLFELANMTLNFDLRFKGECAST